MKNLRYLLWGMVGLFAAAAVFVALGTDDKNTGIGLGAPFELQTSDGKPFTLEDMRGSPHLVFFGFTHCPEICPTTLAEATSWMDALGEEAKDIRIYFITVDPERDTPQVLANYLSPFSDRVTGLTGSLEDMDKAAKGFHVYYRKVDLDDGGYTMDHTASVFLMKPDGTFMGTIAFSENPDTALDKLRRLLAS